MCRKIEIEVLQGILASRGFSSRGFARNGFFRSTDRYVLMGSTELIKFVKRIFKLNTSIKSMIFVIYGCKMMDVNVNC